MMMHGRNCQNGWYGRHFLIHITIGKDHKIASFVNRFLSLTADILQGILQCFPWFFFLCPEKNRDDLMRKLILIKVLYFAQIGIGNNGGSQFYQFAVGRRFTQNIFRNRSDIIC